MSYIQRKANTAYGIRMYLYNKGVDVTGRGKKENDIMIAFLKEKGLKYVKWNYKYKGINTPNLINAEVVQEHWEEFKEWINLNY